MYIGWWDVSVGLIKRIKLCLSVADMTDVKQPSRMASFLLLD